jgi:uncharacterized membrane protein
MSNAHPLAALIGHDGAELSFWFLAFCVSSVGMQLLNKAIAVSFKETGVLAMDNMLMAWQQFAAIGLNFFCISFIGGDIWAIRPVTKIQVKRLMLPTIVFVLMLLCSLKALKSVHVATVVVARNLCTVVVCAGEALFFNRVTSSKAVFSLFVILAGSVVYGFSDLTFELHGYLWQAANSILFCTAQLYEKWAMDKSTDQTPLGMSTIKNSLSLPVLGGLMVVNGDWRFTGVSAIPRWTWFLIAISGVGCCALSIVYMMLYSKASATSIAVGGNFNKAVSIILAAYLFHSPLGLFQTVGLSICLLGSLQYSLLSIRPPKKAE